MIIFFRSYSGCANWTQIILIFFRSIPSMIDGLKPGQRKVIFTCIKRNDKREVKVAQLAGSVAEHSAYHHGESYSQLLPKKTHNPISFDLCMKGDFTEHPKQ